MLNLHGVLPGKLGSGNVGLVVSFQLRQCSCTGISKKRNGSQSGFSEPLSAAPTDGPVSLQNGPEDTGIDPARAAGEGDRRQAHFFNQKSG